MTATTPGPLAATSLSDDFPVLLGPVRLETRFTDTELLIRIFPDEWSTEKFEPRPTEAEITALDAYWTALWRSGGEPVAEQAAWHELSDRIQAGRASWLLQTRLPANPTERPTGVPAGTAVLPVVTGQAVPTGDRQPTITYWTSVWRAHGDPAGLRAADVALRTAVNNDRARGIRARRPVGIDAAPTAPGDAVAVTFLVLPPVPAAQIAEQSWSRAAQARLLPDRFTVLGQVGGQQVLSATGAQVPATLAVSPDPSADPARQLRVDEATGTLRVPDELRWLTDFDRAVAVGMGLRVPLTDQLRGGLDKLVVLGLRAGSGPESTAVELADLISRQLRSPDGYSLLPQGTPTNNTEARSAGQDVREEAEAGLRTALGLASGERSAFGAVLAAGPTQATSAPDGWTGRTDGQWFAELLGLDPAVLLGMPNADRTDLRDARAAHTALWPATWGSYLRTMLPPMLSDAVVDQTREFFLRYVSGRGPLPAVKIGRQPYGILPTTAFSRLAWPGEGSGPAHRRRLHTVLATMAEDWRNAVGKVARLGATGDPHQLLLDILALHPSSAEFHQRYAQSVEDIYNRENFFSGGPRVVPALEGLNMPQPLRALLTRLGYTGADPDLVRRLFAGDQFPLLGPLVDDRPLSETEPIRGYLPDGRNYLHWLAEHARTGLETVRLESGFTGDRPPAALLHLLARHAVLLGWEDAGRRLAAAAHSPVPSAADPLFVHVTPHPAAGPPLPSESRFRQLYSPDPAITGDPRRLVVDFVPDVFGSHPATAQLAEQVEALGLLADLPTARLERVLAEHLDCATYRLDAWRLGLVNERLTQLRRGPDGTAAPRRGIHLGAYGWLEDVRPRSRTGLTTVQLSGKQAAVFTPPGSAPLLHDPANGGYIHAPSPSHATTAAVLRAGYLANGTEDKPDTFAVNLSSERVRVALSLLDGMRQGQSLGALLGHRFERGLHDRHPGVELDVFITALRGEFPLRAGRLPGAEPGPGVSVDVVEARNVVDGLELVQRVTRVTGAAHYPFGADPAHMPPADDAQRQAMDAEIARLLDARDALADLAVAEGAHQSLLGNPERAAATLDAYAKEGLAPEPAVVRTPRSGTTLTHRLALQFTPGLRPGQGAPSFQGDAPRAKAEPAVNDWLTAVLPDQDDVAALVTWTDPRNAVAHDSVVTLRDLRMEPIELLWALRPADEAAMTDLDDRIVGVVATRDRPPRPDTKLTVRHTRRVPGKVTFFELSPLIAALRSLLTTSRPVRPTDLVPAAGAETVDRTADDAVRLPRERPAAVREALRELRDDVARYLADLTPLFPAPPAPPRRADLLDRIDDLLERYAELVVDAGGFGMVRSGWGELYAWRRQLYADVLAEVERTADRMARALADAEALIAVYDALPSATSVPERFRRLEQIDRLLATRTATPRPPTPQNYRTVIGNRRQTFRNKLQDLRGLAETDERTVHGLLDDVADELPLTGLDPAGLDLAPFQDRVVVFARELLDRTLALRAEITGRLAAADKALTDHDQAESAPDRLRAATGTLKALLGEDVLAVPEYTLSDRLATDWRRARQDTEDLVEHLVEDFGRDFPVDDWLHGLARVRAKPRLWEQVTVLTDALRGDGGLLGNRPDFEEPLLEPVQFPYREDDHWLAMEFAPGTTLDEDRVLFTAHYATRPLPQREEMCGLLLDEWTEVVPADRETTGIALSFDRPDSEPPQALLLVTPPVRTGTWNTDDLVAALHETYELMKARAVEPGHLDDTAYAHLLPATVLSATPRPVTISTDLAANNLRWKSP
ncbi:hypothetical protein ACPYPG_33960 [Streptomyces sp. FR-108]|uniref:hypothetical protein n=1 Tax=Streptomyces sp. FR-108 TaxID=3416665 RepID=UPI003CF5C91B